MSIRHLNCNRGISTFNNVIDNKVTQEPTMRPILGDFDLLPFFGEREGILVEKSAIVPWDRQDSVVGIFIGCS